MQPHVCLFLDKDKMIGNSGEVVMFSFHVAKFFNMFEGGAVVTNDNESASRIRLMTNFGFKNYGDVAYLCTDPVVDKPNRTFFYSHRALT